ncbi:MAG: ribosome maturation factor RimM [Chloroflexaceae bacterium]
MMTPAPDELLIIGRIVAPFGVRGQVKLRAVTDRPDHLQRHVRTVYVGAACTPYQLVHVIQHKPGLLILTLKDVTSRDAAEELRNTEVSIRESDAAPLDPGEYYIHELYGLRVETTEGTVVGQVREILETGANEVLIVARPGQSDALIPMIHDIVQELDLEGKRLVIQPMEGLL